MKKITLTITMIVLLTGFFIGSAASVLAIDVGVAWVGKSGMAKRVTKGFSDTMKTLAPDVKLEYHKELGSIDELAVLTAKWKNEKAGMVILRSNAAKWLAKNPPSIPTFIGGCNHPGQLGAVKNLEAPEGNITGVTYYLPIKQQFEVFSEIIPSMKSILLLLGKGNPSSLIDQAGTKKVCAEMGIQYNEKFCVSVDEAAQAVKAQVGKVSAIIIGNQSIVIDGAKDILEASGNTPVLAYSSKPAQAGALCGFVADDEKLGNMLAESLVDVLKNGKAIKDVPVKVDTEPKFYINAKTAEKLGVEVPFSILEAAVIIE